VRPARAGSYHVAVIYQHPLAYLAGLEGIALLRAFTGEYDRDFTHARLAELRALLEMADQFGDGAETGPITTAEGYRAWAGAYDHPGNRLIDLEQPIVRQILDGLPRGTTLDAACGTGRHAEYLASLGPPRDRRGQLRRDAGDSPGKDPRRRVFARATCASCPCPAGTPTSWCAHSR
jgi:hypothetical protein